MGFSRLWCNLVGWGCVFFRHSVFFYPSPYSLPVQTTFTLQSPNLDSQRGVPSPFPTMAHTRSTYHHPIWDFQGGSPHPPRKQKVLVDNKRGLGATGGRAKISHFSHPTKGILQLYMMIHALGDVFDFAKMRFLREIMFSFNSKKLFDNVEMSMKNGPK